MGALNTSGSLKKPPSLCSTVEYNGLNERQQVERYRSKWRDRSNKVTSQPGMIPKVEFVKVRRYVLDYLKRNSDSNGYMSICHSGLENAIMYAGDLKTLCWDAYRHHA